MDGDAEIGRERERLRADLLDFLLAELATRSADGRAPELAGALAEAIDRRVDGAIADRLAGSDFPDPRRFADEVLAAAGGAAPRRSTAGKAASQRSSQLLPFLLGFVTALGVALVAWLVFNQLSRTPVETNIVPPLVNGVEPTSTGPVNILVQEPANQAAPAAANGQVPAR